MQIDHIDSMNPFDNRLSNLRAATLSLQNHNKTKRNNNMIDKYRGVNYMKGKYHTFVNHKSYKAYDRAEEAAHHANLLFIEEHGDDANLNKIDWSKWTTKENRITDEMLTPDFIDGLEFIKDIYDIIKRKKINIGSGGFIRMEDVIVENLERLKCMVLRHLFPDIKLYDDHVPPLIITSERKAVPEIITVKHVQKVKTITELKKIIMKLRLNKKAGGHWRMDEIKVANMEEVKESIYLHLLLTTSF